MRFVFTSPAEAAAGLLTLPWDRPLEEWTDDRLIEIRQRGLSRHIVRFVVEAGEVFAVKKIDERLARREHHLLRRLQQLGASRPQFGKGARCGQLGSPQSSERTRQRGCPSARQVG